MGTAKQKNTEVKTMNREKFTQKSMLALSSALELARERSNQAVEPEHLILALLTADGGLIPELLLAMGRDTYAQPSGRRVTLFLASREARHICREISTSLCAVPRRPPPR